MRIVESFPIKVVFFLVYATKTYMKAPRRPTHHHPPQREATPSTIGTGK